MLLSTQVQSMRTLRPFSIFFCFGIAQQIGVDHLPGGIGYGFDVFIQGGFFKSFVRNAYAAKPAQRLASQPGERPDPDR